MLNHKVDRIHSTARWMNHLCSALSLFITMSVMTFLSPAVQAQPQDGTFSLGGFAEVVNNSPALGHPKAFRVPSTCKGDCLNPKDPKLDELTTASLIWLPDSTMRFKDINRLSADYRRLPGNGDCGGGSPRFEIALDVNGDGKTDGRAFVYFGQLYNFTDCSFDWQNSGNFINNGADFRWDLTQFGGLFYSNYGNAIAGLGEAVVDYIILVVDGSWVPVVPVPFGATRTQAFQFDRVRVNNDTYDANKAGSFTKAEGPSIARLNLEQYVSGISGPRSLFGEDSFLGRRYSMRSLLRMLGQSRTSSSRSSQGTALDAAGRVREANSSRY